jgi:hypothetical protein
MPSRRSRLITAMPIAKPIAPAEIKPFEWLMLLPGGMLCGSLPLLF